MDSAALLVHSILSFLLELLTLLVNFLISALQLVLQFAQQIVSGVH